MLSAAAGLVIKHHDRRSGVEPIGSVRPQVCAVCFTCLGVELLHGGFIGMQHLALFDQFGESIYQGCQCETHATYPVA